MGRKRKDSSLIPNHKRPLVSCLICKAPATGFHYGIDACGACKGFFYRCITQNVYYRCEKDNNCTIDFKSAKFCQKCRYAKCLAYGMSKNASKIGRYPSFKKTEELLQRLRQNSGRFQNSQTYFDTTLSPVSDTEPSPAKRPCSRLQNPADTNMPDSTDLSLFHTPSGLRNSQSPFFDHLPQSDFSSLSPLSTASPLFDLSMTPGRNDCSLPTKSSSPESCDSSHLTSSDIAIPDASSLQLRSLSPPVASAVWQKSDSTTLSDSTVDCCSKHNSPLSFVSWNHNNNNNDDNNNNNNANTHIQHCSPHLAQTQKIPQCDTPSSGLSLGDDRVTHESLSKSPIQAQGLPHTVSSSRSGLSSSELTDLPHISDSSADNKINQEPPDLRAMSLVDESTAEVMEKLSELYADSDSIVRKFLETERNTLRFKARDINPKEILDEQLNHKNRHLEKQLLPENNTAMEFNIEQLNQQLVCILKIQLQRAFRDLGLVLDPSVLKGLSEACICRTKMFGRKNFLEESEYEDVLNNTGLDIDDRKQYVARKFKFLEATILGIATFAKSIPGFKYIPLEQKSRLIKYSRWDLCFMSVINVTNPDLMVTISRSKGWVCPLDYDEEVASEVVVPSITLIGRIQKLDLTDEELVILMAIALVSPDRSEPTNSTLVSCIHGHLVNLLLKRLRQNHDQPMRQFAAIVAMLTELRTLEFRAASTFLKGLKNVVRAELRARPLAQEMIPPVSFQ